LGGGWAFGINGSGDKILFGAQSTEDPIEYDLYICDWETGKIEKVSDFRDRWFSMAELSRDGEKIVFYYSGKKKQGIGTYLLRPATSDLQILESSHSPRVEFFDLSGNGRYVLYKHIYDGFLLDVTTGEESIAFNKDTQGYVHGLVPMDFPRFPAFWGSHIISEDGSRILLSGIPEGKKDPEVYLLAIEKKQ
jgi:hypothetical protein